MPGSPRMRLKESIRSVPKTFSFQARNFAHNGVAFDRYELAVELDPTDLVGCVLEVI